MKERQEMHANLATSGATAVLRVRRAVHELLRGEDEQVLEVDGEV